MLPNDWNLPEIIRHDQIVAFSQDHQW